jgi:hypothetical protein
MLEENPSVLACYIKDHELFDALLTRLNNSIVSILFKILDIDKYIYSGLFFSMFHYFDKILNTLITQLLLIIKHNIIASGYKTGQF